MSPRFRKIRLWLGLFLVMTIALLIGAAAKRISDVAAVQNAIERDFEIYFSDERSLTDKPGGLPTFTDKPGGLPTFIDSAVEAWFDRRFAHTIGYDGPQPRTRNRNTVYYERFRSLFRGSIHDIHIQDPEKFRGDALGAALARFPSLRRVSVSHNQSTGPTESEWTLLCRRLRTLPQLEEIELGGSWLTDAAIEPLAGHPNLRVVTILDGRLSPRCAKTFAAIPRLATLHIEGQRYDGDTWLTPEEEATMRAALPGVTLEVP